MRTRWNSLTASGRFILTVHLSVAAFCLAAALIDTITLVMLNIVVMFWLAFTITTLTIQHRRLNKIAASVKRTSALVANGTTDFSSLPPEDQEEIQISWAKHVLKGR